MLETALIDGDMICYRTAAAYANEDLNLCLWQVGELVRRILHETNAMGFKCFLTGDRNFRYDIYKEYKANRKDVPRPAYLQPCREYLVTEWNASVTDGIEADDALGIEQCSLNTSDHDTSIIVSNDKDMLTIPGRHYNPTNGVMRLVSPLEAKRNLYYQLIMGDRADNVPGYDGKMRMKVPKFLEPHVAVLESCMNEWEMYEHVLGMYEGDTDTMHRNAKVLYIWQKENDEWIPPVENYGEEKQTEGLDGSESQGIYN